MVFPSFSGELTIPQTKSGGATSAFVSADERYQSISDGVELNVSADVKRGQFRQDY